MGRHWAWFPTEKVLTYLKCGVFFPCRKNSLALLISVNQRSRIHFKRKKKKNKRNKLYFGILLSKISDSNFFSLQTQHFQLKYPGDKPWKKR